MNTPHDKPKARGMRLVLALAAISLTIGSCYLFAASACAQNAAGQTIESADFETAAIWTFMLAQCPATAWVVTRPGASVWRSAWHGVLLNIVGLMLMFVLAMAFSSVFDPSSRRCIDTVGALPWTCWRSSSAGFDGSGAEVRYCTAARVLLSAGPIPGS